MAGEDVTTLAVSGDDGDAAGLCSGENGGGCCGEGTLSYGIPVSADVSGGGILAQAGP